MSSSSTQPFAQQRSKSGRVWAYRASSLASLCVGIAIAGGAEPTIELTAPLVDVRSQGKALIGGVSDLALAPDGSGLLWATTDRGPNGTKKVAGRKHRTLMVPDFTPEILAIELAIATGDSPAREIGRAHV